MGVVSELIRTEADGTISFGDYTLTAKTKLDNFEYKGDIYKVKTLEVLADKGYFDSNDIHQCEREEIITYVSKPCYSNGIGDSRYFSEKFKYIFIVISFRCCS